MTLPREVTELRRAVREVAQSSLFEEEPIQGWREHWWGMPSFEQGDATPGRRIQINFLTDDDVRDFAEKLGRPISPQTDSMWWPPQQPLSGEFEYDGLPTDSKYPICIPSKGRADVQKTGKALDRLGVSYRFFVEETEGDEYIRRLGRERVVVMPFHDLGQGSIPARNFIWAWAQERGVARHWTVDDNIVSFARTHNNRRLCVRGGGFFRAMEDFVDRYENVAMAGPHHKGFVLDRDPNLTPYLLNSRVYSCILLDTNLPHRWRGRYNEDTDLSLRLLKDGFCTLLFRALCMDKGSTSTGGNGRSPNALKGGNTDHVYNTGDHRREFAESLQRQHPDLVSVVWKFDRWHHTVDYRPFRRNRLVLKPGVTPTGYADEYGMSLRRVAGKEADVGGGTE